MGLKLNTASSGSVTLEPENTASNYTLTVPAQTGTIATTVDAGNYYSFKNRIINGNMAIDQRNAGASVTVAANTSKWSVDRFLGDNSSTSSVAYSMQQVTDAPTGFSNSLKVTVTSSGATGSADYQYLRQAIEGYNFADLMFGTANAQTFTLSFWVKSSVTGTFGGYLGAASNVRFRTFSYTINSANTWEYKTVTITGDTTGTWNNTNGVGLQVAWSLACGTTYQGATGSWGSSLLLGATGQVNLTTTSSATFYITGVQLEKGSVATSFDYRPYGTELALCQRYYEQSTQGNDFIWLGYCSSGIIYYLSIPYKVTKRSAPTITTSTPGVNAFNGATLGATDIQIDKFNSYCVANATSVGGFFYIRFTASSEL